MNGAGTLLLLRLPACERREGTLREKQSGRYLAVRVACDGEPKPLAFPMREDQGVAAVAQCGRDDAEARGDGFTRRRRTEGGLRKVDGDHVHVRDEGAESLLTIEIARASRAR